MTANTCTERIAVTKETHRELKMAAAKEGMAMHKFLQKLLEGYKAEEGKE